MPFIEGDVSLVPDLSMDAVEAVINSTVTAELANGKVYVLREAWCRHEGDRLGEVGGRIAGEVLYGVIARDPESYLVVEPEWLPTLPRHENRFGVRDLLVPA